MFSFNVDRDVERKRALDKLRKVLLEPIGEASAPASESAPDAGAATGELGNDSPGPSSPGPGVSDRVAIDTSEDPYDDAALRKAEEAMRDLELIRLFNLGEAAPSDLPRRPSGAAKAYRGLVDALEFQWQRKAELEALGGEFPQLLSTDDPDFRPSTALPRVPSQLLSGPRVVHYSLLPARETSAQALEVEERQLSRRRRQRRMEMRIRKSPLPLAARPSLPEAFRDRLPPLNESRLSRRSAASASGFEY